MKLIFFLVASSVLCEYNVDNTLTFWLLLSSTYKSRLFELLMLPGQREAGLYKLLGGDKADRNRSQRCPIPYGVTFNNKTGGIG